MSSLEHERLLAKYDTPAPRYTSYPPANQFHVGVGPVDYRNALARLDASSPVALYVHLPFCESRCTYCGCFVVQAKRHSISQVYLDHLLRELRLVKGALRSQPRVVSMHLGGGTPTYLEPQQLEALFSAVNGLLDVRGATELAVELDPRVTTRDHLLVLRRNGVNRVSLGVQDTSDEVQEAIGRHQSHDMTVECFRACREVGFESINIDLVYGLPLQTEARFAETLRNVLELRPERIAVFGYAHVPSLRPNQRAIDASTLPTGAERLRQSSLAHVEAARAGYVHIGLDHFALPGDELCKAREEGRLGRSFMGYTPWRGVQVLAFGVSSISEVAGSYFQNLKKLSEYFECLERDELPTERGFLTSFDDTVRRHVIHSILGELRVSGAELTAEFGITFEGYFAQEVERLSGFVSDGLLRLVPGGLEVTAEGRHFLRNIAMTFDRYAADASRRGALFSRAV